MKRIGYLYEQVISLDNLRLADMLARRGKSHRADIRDFDKHREQNLIALHESLKNQTFHSSEYKLFKIYEPKEREIARLPYYPDRIVHQAIVNVLEPIWVKTFPSFTYSCIKNRGIHKCAEDVKNALHTDVDGTKWCLSFDIKKFYPSIHHDVLKQVVRRKIKDPKMLWLLDEIIDSFDKGVPIGNYPSQFLANLMLAYLLHRLKARFKNLKYVFQYSDDGRIFASTKEILHEVARFIRTGLKELKLKMKKNMQVFEVDKRGVDFVGFVFYHTHTLIRKRIKQSLCRRVSHMLKRKKKPTSEEFHSEIASWWGWCKYSNSVNLINTIQKSYGYEIRFIRTKRVLRSDARKTADV